MATNQIDKAAQLEEEERLKKEAADRLARARASVEEYQGFYGSTAPQPTVLPVEQQQAIVEIPQDTIQVQTIGGDEPQAPVADARGKLMGDIDTLLGTGRQVGNVQVQHQVQAPIVDAAAKQVEDERVFKEAALAEGYSQEDADLQWKRATAQLGTEEAEVLNDKVKGTYASPEELQTGQAAQPDAYNPNLTPPGSPVPVVSGTNVPVSTLTQGSNSQEMAVKNNVPPATASFMAMDKLEYDQYGRARIPAAEWGMSFDTGFEHRSRDYTDGQSLWQGILAGGIAALGAAMLGGNSKDIGGVFFLAGADRFGKALNESARYKNLDALLKQGFTPQSAEQFIVSGNRDDLKKHEIEDWKEYPDGSGRMYRTLPNGEAEVMKGNPKYEPIDIKDGWQTVRKFWNPHYGFQQTKDGQGDVMITLDSGTQAQANYQATLQRYSGNNSRQSVNAKGVWMSSDKTGEKFQAVRGNDGMWYDYLTNQPITSMPDDVREMTPAEITSYGKQQGLNAQAQTSAQHGQEMMTYNTQKIYDDKGNVNTVPPMTGNKIMDTAAQGNWAILGGGRGELPMGENLLSSFSPEVRDVITDAKVIQGQIRQLAISQAKAAGASGINTVAEIRLFAESFPPIDFRSYEGMVKSMDNLRQYYDVYFNRYLEKINSTPSLRVGSNTADGQSTLSHTGAGNEQQEDAAWKEMKVYYGGGRGAQYLTPEMAEIERKRLSGSQGTQPGVNLDSARNKYKY